MFKKIEGNVDEDDAEIQAKGGVGLLFRDNQRFHVIIITSWDLDTFSGTNWDGGGVRLQVRF